MKQIVFIATLLASLPLIGQNLVSSDSWTVSSGSIGVFDQNGPASMNIREMGSNPYGEQSILWKAVPDAANNADGGWTTSWFNIDETKMYRFAVWIKKTNSNDGHTYFGCYGNDILNLTGGINSNPYFFVGDVPSLNKWYLLVGYVHASSDPSTSNYGGIYDGDTGLKVVGLTDFKFSPGANSAVHRTYLYYDTNTSDRQYFYDPQVYALDGQRPLEETALPDFKNGEVYFNKNVGVGTSAPASILHINSSIERESFRIYKNGNTTNYLNIWQGEGAAAIDPIGTGKLYLGYDQSTDVYMGSNGGNVGIGTTTPDSKLTVKGVIHTQEVKVDLNGSVAPDYVFEKDYPLTSLEELKSYIDHNKHLPEVPSAKEMEEEGVNLKEMNLLLLRKIEEMTLHLIDQNQQFVQLKEESRVSAEASTKKVEELTLHILELKKMINTNTGDIKTLKEPTNSSNNEK